MNVITKERLDTRVGLAATLRAQRQGWVKLACFDPSMRNWGLVKAEIDPVTFEMDVLEMKLVQTEGQAGKTVRKSSDDLRRAAEVYEAALEFALWADVIAAEVPSGSQSSRASLGAGMSIMALAALSLIRPLIEVNPIEVKKNVTGRKTASKDEMIQWAVREYPDAAWLSRKLRGERVWLDSNEHLADAVAIGRTALTTPAFRSAIRMVKAITR